MSNTEPTEDKLRALLPWYVTGKISDHDRALVESGLKAHPALTRELELIRIECRSVEAVAEQVLVPSDVMWDKLATRMADERRSQTAGAAESSSERSLAAPAGSGSFQDVIAAFKAWAAGFMRPLPQTALAGIAAAVIILQAVIIGYLWSAQDQGASYQTASGSFGEQLDRTTRLLITFRQGATIDRVTNLLRHIGAQTVSGPKSSGFYIVQVNISPSDTPAIDRLVAQLRGRPDLVSFVTPALPETAPTPKPKS